MSFLSTSMNSQHPDLYSVPWMVTEEHLYMYMYENDADLYVTEFMETVTNCTMEVTKTINFKALSPAKNCEYTNET